MTFDEERSYAYQPFDRKTYEPKKKDGDLAMESIFSNSEDAIQEQQDQVVVKDDSASINTDWEAIEQSVKRRLQCCPYPELGAIQVSCKEGLLTLRGALPSYFLKQLVQEIAKGIPDVDVVRNECTVTKPHK